MSNRKTKNNPEHPSLNDELKTVSSVLALMTGIYVLFQFILPVNLAQQIGTIGAGLILTWVMVKLGWLNQRTAYISWVIAAIVVFAIYFLVTIRPTTVVSRVVDGSEKPIVDLALVLTDSSGVEHKAITDEKGAFEIPNVPAGKFFIHTGNELLFSGDIPTGWRRLIDWTEKPGGSIVYKFPAPTPIATLIPQTETPMVFSTPWSFWGDICPQCEGGFSFEYRVEGAPDNILIINENSIECAHTGKIGISVTYDLTNKDFDASWGIHWKDESTKHFDASQYKFLTFFVKGSSGGEKFMIGAKDLDGHIITLESDRYALLSPSEWTSVIVPLDQFTFNNTTVDVSSLENISISFNQTHGSGSICVDEFVFIQ